MLIYVVQVDAGQMEYYGMSLSFQKAKENAKKINQLQPYLGAYVQTYEIYENTYTELK